MIILLWQIFGTLLKRFKITHYLNPFVIYTNKLSNHFSVSRRKLCLQHAFFSLKIIFKLYLNIWFHPSTLCKWMNFKIYRKLCELKNIYSKESTNRGKTWQKAGRDFLFIWGLRLEWKCLRGSDMLLFHITKPTKTICLSVLAVC